MGALNLVSFFVDLARRYLVTQEDTGRSKRQQRKQWVVPTAPRAIVSENRRASPIPTEDRLHTLVGPKRRTARKARDAWIPVGKSVVIKGRTLRDGMVYAGQFLPGVSKYVATDPALIDPSLPVDDRSPDTKGLQMGYWPSYSGMTPASRAAYLDWLAQGRPGGAYVGYVFLFFYGIERRILYDTDRSDISSAETGALIAEVQRLLRLYRENKSFSGYAGEFLSFVNCLRADRDLSQLEPPLVRQGWELPLELKLGLGSIVAAGDPLPASWALSWLRLSPEISLRTPALRCPDEFNDLFMLRYQQAHGSGIKIPRNKTLLTHFYRPASASFSHGVRLGAGDLPDVTRLKRPIRRLQRLAETVADDLDQYSRWVGRHGDRDSLGAIALLPHDLASQRQSTELRDLVGRIESALEGEDMATMPVSDVVAVFPSQRADAFSMREATTFAQLAERLGFGIAPDIRYSKINLTKHKYVAVFRLPGQHSQPSDRYLAATVLLHLGAAVGAADGTVTADEERLLETHLEQALELPLPDRYRLRAHLRWLLIEPPTLNRMKSRLQALTPSDRGLIARFVITVAGADGIVSSDEIKVLDRVYKLIGLNTEQLHRDIHELASKPATTPVTVIRPEETTRYRVPPPPTAHSLGTDRVELDRERIAEVMKATREVSDLLTEIFEGPPATGPLEPDAVVAEQEGDLPTAIVSCGPLDHAHAQLVQYLARQPYWPRGEFEQSAAKLGLMPAGAMETINDVAFKLCDEPFIEGDDPLEVNEVAVKELLDVT